MRDHCHITRNYGGSVHNDCNLNIKLKYKIPVVFHNWKNYDSCLIMQELSQCNFKINIIPNGLEKYMSFNINNKLVFIDSVPFLCSLLDSLVRNVDKDDFKYFK